MRVTITIDEEQVLQAGTMQPDEAEETAMSGEMPAEAKPTSAGGPPAWLLQEIEGGGGEPEPAQMTTGAMDAGPAPPATGNGPASLQAFFGRRS
jgi:hypothetical protein